MTSQKNLSTLTFNAPSQTDLDMPDGLQSSKFLEKELETDDEGNADLELGLRYYYGQQVSQDLDQALKHLISAAYWNNQKAIKNLQLLLSKNPALATKHLWDKFNLDRYDHEAVNSTTSPTYFFDSFRESSRDTSRKFVDIMPLPPNPYQSQTFQMSTPPLPGELEHQSGNTLYKQERYLESLPHFKKAAEQGYIAAYLRLARLYEGDLCEPKSTTYVDWTENKKQSQLYYQKVRENLPLFFKEQEETGKAEAQFNYGLCCYYSKKLIIAQNPNQIQENFKQAVFYFHLAAKQGHSLAQYMLGLCYKKGIGVDQDFVMAAYFFESATRDNCTLAQKELGLCYYHGKGVMLDFPKAVHYFKWAADQGDRDGQAMLGLCYYYGQGVGKNLAEALRYLRLASSRGEHPLAFPKLSAVQNDLGVCYATGDGVNKNLFEAEEHFEKTIAYRNQSAQGAQENLHAVRRELGLCYEKGEGGVPQDLVRALRYFRSAANGKNFPAIKELKRLLLSHPNLASKLLLSDFINSDHSPTANAFSGVFSSVAGGGNSSMNIASAGDNSSMNITSDSSTLNNSTFTPFNYNS